MIEYDSTPFNANSPIMRKSTVNRFRLKIHSPIFKDKQEDDHSQTSLKKTFRQTPRAKSMGIKPNFGYLTFSGDTVQLSQLVWQCIKFKDTGAPNLIPERIPLIKPPPKIIFDQNPGPILA
jgi:hypothetical protein